MKTSVSLCKKTISWLCIVALVASVLTGCTSNNTNEKKTDEKGITPVKNEVVKISILTNTYSGDPMREDSPALKALQEYTNAEVKFTWVPSQSYNDKLNIMLASGELPMIVFLGSKTSSIISAIRAGAFWEIGPHLKNYKNLAGANPVILNNISVDGKVYGLYRSRVLARTGAVYRKDWLDAVGLKEPKSLDEFYEMLKAFTLKDPDKNGKNDTYGLVLTNHGVVPYDSLRTWFGAPNNWGEDKNGKLVPAHLTDEYTEMVKFLRKLYVEKLINQDFPLFDVAKMNDPFINGVAGCVVDIAERANKLTTDTQKLNPSAVIDVFGGVPGSKGLKLNPTSGYNGFYGFSKAGIKDEATLKQALAFMDKIGDSKMLDLVGYGLEGRNYRITNGKMEIITDASIPKNDNNDLNQIMTFSSQQGTPLLMTPIQEKIDKLTKENEKYIVGNPAEPLISNTYTMKGAQLDTMINDARTKFIVGQLDEAGYKAALEQWRKSGGDDYIREINEEYAKLAKK